MIVDLFPTVRRLRSLFHLVLFVMLGLGWAVSRAPAAQSVQLTWSSSPTPGVVAYRVYYGTESGFYFNGITFSNIADVVIPNLDEGATYYFAVTAVDAAGNESDFSNEASYVVPVSGPHGLQAQAASPTSRDAQLTWYPSPQSDVYGYTVYYGTEPGNYTQSQTFYDATNATIFVLTGGKTYYFAVAAIDSFGVQNKLSNVAPYAVPVPPPAVLQSQTFTDENGKPYLMRINSSSAVCGAWELDYSTDLENWSPFTYGYGYGNGDGYDVEVYTFLDSSQTQIFFRLINY
jgi:hypothetical protein